MRPYPEEVLRAIQAGVVAHFAPELQSAYGKAQLAFAMMLFTIAQRDYDTAVPELIEANRTLRALLANADAALATIDQDDAQAARGAMASLPPQAATLKLSDLRAENAGLRVALAGLAPLIEPAADEPSLMPLRDVRAAVSAYLAADARKRIVPILSV